MSNLDMKVIDPDIENDPSFKKLIERIPKEEILQEIFHPENIHKISQQKSSQQITSITIENFKCIGDAITIPIRPITLLFGKNSSGKSTVLQALQYGYKMWCGQIVSGIEMSGGYNIDFRDFRSLVHRQELDRKIRIRIQYASVLNTLYKDDTQYKDDTENYLYECREVVTGWKDGHCDIVSWLWVFSRNDEELVRLIERLASPSDIVVGSSGEELIRLEKKEEGFPEDFPEIYVNTNTDHKDWIDDFLNTLRNITQNPEELKNQSNIPHLGPFREVPGDYYTISQMPEELTWEKGLGAWDLLARDPEMVEKTNHYIQNVLKLGYSINRRAHNATDSEQWPRLHDENNDIDVRLSDIGVGIAQIIPVVVGALDDSQISGIFAVEQPELHVHPAVQVALGDVFIESIKRSDYSTMQATMKEAWYEFLSMAENSKKELLDTIKNINEPAIKAIDKIIDKIEDTDPGDVEAIDKIIDKIKDNDSLDAQFKDFFKIKEKYDHDIQVTTKEFGKILIKELFISDIKNSNRTMLIETHSEHLLLRLLRRVRETTRRSRYQTNDSEKTYHELTPNDLSVVYVRPTPAGVKFTPLTVTDKGDFDAPWPEGFFEERDSEWY